MKREDCTTLVSGISKLKLDKIQDKIFELARPMIGLNTKTVKDATIPIGATKLGGLPDLPKDAKWPLFTGKPMAFLGQFALADLHGKTAAAELSTDGILYVFAYQSDGDGPGCFAEGGDTVIIKSASTQGLERRKAPADIDESNDTSPSCLLEMHESYDIPDWYGDPDEIPEEFYNQMEDLRDAYNAAIGDSDRDETDGQLSDKLWELRSGLNKKFDHHLFGYSFHSRTTEPSPGADWVHILCLGSDSKLGWNWCDGENLAIFVKEDSLKDDSFKEVFGYAS